MGIFSNAETMYAPVNVPMAEGYEDDQYSAQMAMIESYQNSYAIFDGVIRSDIQESAMKYGGATYDEVMVFTEGVIGDLFNKIKEFFKKLWAKIKAIFHNFMAKWDSKMMTSNKEFIKKYRKDIYGKNIQDLEVEMRVRKSTDLDFTVPVSDFVLDHSKTGAEMDSEIEKFDSDDYTCKILSSTLGGSNNAVSSVSEYEKEAMDYLFEDSAKEEVKNHLSGIITRMMEFKDTKRSLEKANKSLNKAMSDLIKQIEKDQKEILDKLPGDGNNISDFKRRQQYSVSSTGTGYKNKSYTHDTNEDEYKAGGTSTELKGGRAAAASLSRGEEANSVSAYQKSLNLIHQKATCVQTAATKMTAMVIKAIKFDNSQNRRVLAKVIAYKKKEEAFSEAFADLVEWEADCTGVY